MAEGDVTEQKTRGGEGVGGGGEVGPSTWGTAAAQEKRCNMKKSFWGKDRKGLGT